MVHHRRKRYDTSRFQERESAAEKSVNMSRAEVAEQHQKEKGNKRTSAFEAVGDAMEKDRRAEKPVKAATKRWEESQKIERIMRTCACVDSDPGEHEFTVLKRGKDRVGIHWRGQDLLFAQPKAKLPLEGPNARQRRHEARREAREEDKEQPFSINFDKPPPSGAWATAMEERDIKKERFVRKSAAIVQPAIHDIKHPRPIKGKEQEKR